MSILHVGNQIICDILKRKFPINIIGSTNVVSEIVYAQLRQSLLIINCPIKFTSGGINRESFRRVAIGLT